MEPLLVITCDLPMTEQTYILKEFRVSAETQRKPTQFRVFQPEIAGLQNPQQKAQSLSKTLHNFILEIL